VGAGMFANCAAFSSVPPRFFRYAAIPVARNLRLLHLVGMPAAAARRSAIAHDIIGPGNRNLRCAFLLLGTVAGRPHSSDRYGRYPLLFSWLCLRAV
jgi:hypothetical protein